MKKIFIGSISALGAYTLVNTYRVKHVKKILRNYDMNHQNAPLTITKKNDGPKLEKKLYKNEYKDFKKIKNIKKMSRNKRHLIKTNNFYVTEKSYMTNLKK